MMNEQDKRNWKLWVAGAATAVAVGLVALISLTPRPPPGSTDGADDPAWYSCFDDALEALAAGDDPDAALMSVEQSYSDASRTETLHRTALAQLHADRRWSDPEQVESLNEAVNETRRFVEESDLEADEAATTMGCLEEY